MKTNELLALQELTQAQREYVLLKVTNQKDTGMAYLWWFIFGVHYFYLKKPIINLLYWITASGFGIWAVIDLFRIPGMVRRYNEQLLKEAILEAKNLYPNQSL
ncbi:TM2 domain-containing protein [Veillonella criceti]|uniref:TM2 domain n=1 Tax=Veillonella criceti TaxID=103891 RepID=A0A380NPB0_9FIRM|nr:TM2 domain-containing protein [Veillonella criceti]SUP44742.1 TM2 domain [Veillonella criceti]